MTPHDIIIRKIISRVKLALTHSPETQLATFFMYCPILTTDYHTRAFPNQLWPNGNIGVFSFLPFSTMHYSSEFSQPTNNISIVLLQ